jgi:hypothetical protein
MASGKCHFKDSLQGATPSLTYHSLAYLQSTADDSPTDAGSTSSISDAATQFSNAMTKISNAAL